MPLIKTDAGKEALRLRDPGLSPRERQIIILANGTLSRATMGLLMEQDIRAEVERLIQCGYLAEGSTILPAAVPTQKLGAAMNVPRQQQLPVSRRSLAGTKMYVMDMLQLLRDMDASAMAVSIHTSEGEMEFIYNVIVAARLIAQKRGPSYGMRVVDKLREIMPETHLPALEALAFELESTSVEA